IFAWLQFRTRLQRDDRTEESPAVDVDHAFTLQDLGDVEGYGTRGNHDRLVLLQRSRSLQGLLAVIIGGAGAEHSDQEKRNDGVADDHKRIARPLRPLRRRRYLLGLQRGARTSWRDGRPFTHRCNLSPE